MSDLISRRAAIDALEWKWAGKAAIDAIKNLPSAQPEQRWIPVGERLPENDDAVLISHKYGVGKAWWNGRHWMSLTTKCYRTVVAWMPLPEPYRKEEQ